MDVILFSILASFTLMSLVLLFSQVVRQGAIFRQLDQSLEEATHSSAARIDRIDYLATSNGQLADSNARLYEELQASSERVTQVATAIQGINNDLVGVKHELEVVRHDLNRISRTMEHLKSIADQSREREITR